MKNKITLLFPFLIFLLLIGCSSGGDTSIETKKNETTKTNTEKKSEERSSKKDEGSFKAELSGFTSESLNGNVKDMSMMGADKAARLYLCQNDGGCITLIVPKENGSVKTGEFKFDDINATAALLEGKSAAGVSWKIENNVLRWDTKSGSITISSAEGKQIKGKFSIKGTAKNISGGEKPNNEEFSIDGDFDAMLKN